MGLLLREHDDPEQVPVAMFGAGLVYLNDSGGWTPVPHISEEKA